MTSPLEGTDHQTLDELFSRDPLDLADKDIEKIVSVLRAQRAKWLIEETEPKAPKGRKRLATAADLASLERDFLS